MKFRNIAPLSVLALAAMLLSSCVAQWPCPRHHRHHRHHPHRHHAAAPAPQAPEPAAPWAATLPLTHDDAQRS